MCNRPKTVAREFHLEYDKSTTITDPYAWGFYIANDSPIGECVVIDTPSGYPTPTYVSRHNPFYGSLDNVELRAYRPHPILDSYLPAPTNAVIKIVLFYGFIPPVLRITPNWSREGSRTYTNEQGDMLAGLFVHDVKGFVFSMATDSLSLDVAVDIMGLSSNSNTTNGPSNSVLLGQIDPVAVSSGNWSYLVIDLTASVSSLPNGEWVDFVYLDLTHGSPMKFDWHFHAFQ